MATPTAFPASPTTCGRWSKSLTSRTAGQRGVGSVDGRMRETESRARDFAGFERPTRTIRGSGWWRERARRLATRRRRSCWPATVDGAQRQLEQASRSRTPHGERVYLPQLLLIEGAIARARGQPAAALASVRSAIKEARAQEAPWLELLALVELCEHEGAKAKDRQALAALVDRLPEAADTNVVAA